MSFLLGHLLLCVFFRMMVTQIRLVSPLVRAYGTTLSTGMGSGALLSKRSRIVYTCVSSVYIDQFFPPFSTVAHSYSI